MKRRTGFISNSSSSSFVIYIPDSLTVTKDDIKNDPSYQRISKEREYSGYSRLHIGELLADIKNLKKGKGATACYETNYEWLREYFDEYIVGSFDTGPDEGQLVPLDKDKLKKLMEK